MQGVCTQALLSLPTYYGSLTWHVMLWCLQFVEERQIVITRKLERIVSRRSSTGGSDSRQFSSRFRDSLSRHLDTIRSLSLKDSVVITPTDQDTPALSHKHSSNDLEIGIKTPHPSLTCNSSPERQTLSKQVSLTLAAAGVPERQAEYVPMVRLLRKHTPAVLLQFLFEAWVSIGFWVITTWLPVQMKKAPINMPEILTQVKAPWVSEVSTCMYKHISRHRVRCIWLASGAV